MSTVFAVGDQVVIGGKQRTRRFEGEPGTIIAFCGKGLKEFAVVATCGQQLLVRVEDLRREP